ncbi:hypothetical protein [Mycobacterium sp. 94-17]|uniref:hypothetical protein n=1 Tax=Mycobacterium sp. 94-17 TaxID=2986147 RepID=UPI002D1F8027|nr:hypothetical protein [Mycobacterium sp. 94-17]MEB4210053.1 hypothetical protein [Mycobacterium sp. 94-17]
MTVGTHTRARVGSVVALLLAATTVTMVMGHPSGSPAPAVIPVDVSRPLSSTVALAPPPPGFPNLDGLSDVSADHVGDNQGIYPLATFTGPSGVQCAMWSSLGDTAASCYGTIPGADPAANHVYASDVGAQFDQNTPPAADKLNGKPLASGQKVVLGAGGTLMGGDQITCGVQGVVVACVVVRGFSQNHGDATAQRHGFVVDPRKSWTF